MASPVSRSGQRAMSPAAKIPGRARFEKGVDGDAAVNLQAGRLGEAETRSHAEAGDNQIGLENGAAA